MFNKKEVIRLKNIIQDLTLENRKLKSEKEEIFMQLRNSNKKHFEIEDELYAKIDLLEGNQKIEM